VHSNSEYRKERSVIIHRNEEGEVRLENGEE